MEYKVSNKRIYCNSCLHKGKEKYVDGKLVITYLIDKRFIININNTINVLLGNDFAICEKQDDYFLLFEDVNEKDEDKYFFLDLFDELQSSKAIMSTSKFTKTYLK